MARMCGMKKSVEFKFNAPNAKRVALAGDFNSWDTKTFVARKDRKGNWLVKASLTPGRYEYKFYVDGNWVSDPNCTRHVANSFGTQNCVIDIK